MVAMAAGGVAGKRRRPAWLTRYFETLLFWATTGGITVVCTENLIRVDEMAESP